jgi:hypothetical protein
MQLHLNISPEAKVGSIIFQLLLFHDYPHPESSRPRVGDQSSCSYPTPHHHREPRQHSPHLEHTKMVFFRAKATFAHTNLQGISFEVWKPKRSKTTSTERALFHSTTQRQLLEARGQMTNARTSSGRLKARGQTTDAQTSTDLWTPQNTRFKPRIIYGRIVRCS